MAKEIRACKCVSVCMGNKNLSGWWKRVAQFTACEMSTYAWQNTIKCQVENYLGVRQSLAYCKSKKWNLLLGDFFGKNDPDNWF